MAKFFELQVRMKKENHRRSSKSLEGRNQKTSGERKRRNRKQMTKLQIIAKLWSVIYDMQLATKPREEIGKELDVLEYECRKYVDTDDLEEMP